MKYGYFRGFFRMAIAPIVVGTMAIGIGGQVLGQEHGKYYPDPDTAIQRRLEEWRDLKFGLLMHWGTYSQWGIVESWSICPEDLGWATGARKKGVGEPESYLDYADYVSAYNGLQKTFNPVKFDPEKWAAAAKEAGMKYMVFTTKHHDGFCMFDSKYTDYKITSSKTPFSTNARSNVAKEVFSAFRKQNFWIGAYFSKPDWSSDYYWWKYFPVSDRNANYSIKKHPEQWKRFVDYTHNQINELVTDYGQVDILWLDGGWVRKKTDDEVKTQLLEEYEGSRFARNPQSQDIDMPRLVKEVRAKQPKVLVVDRDVPGEQQNYLTPEQEIPKEGLPYPWETCMTMANSWSYVPNDTYKPAEDLIKKLVDIVSKGGNYLLNIGPGPDGELDANAYARLKEIGAWMKVNGEAIYGSRMYRVFKEGDSVRYTQSKDGRVKYVFVMGYPKGKLVLSELVPEAGAKMRMLGSNKLLKWSVKNGKTEIVVPEEMRGVSKYVWAIEIQSGERGAGN